MADKAQARLAVRRSPEAARRILSDLVPPRLRAAVAAALAHSIRHAHRAAPSKWGVRLNPDSIMLKVGFVEVFQLGDGWFHELVLTERVAPTVFADRRLTFGTARYKNAPGCEGCNGTLAKLRSSYELLREAHEAAIDVAARSPLHTTTIPTHSPGLVVFLADELRQLIPQPSYLVEAIGDGASLPEEVPADAELREGAVRQILVNRYERDPEARRRCIAHHGSACAVCGLEMSARYGPDVEGLIHVHHLTPVSELGDALVDPVRDLRPVCPNCHAVIHSGPDAKSIETVRSMLR